MLYVSNHYLLPGIKFYLVYLYLLVSSQSKSTLQLCQPYDPPHPQLMPGSTDSRTFLQVTRFRFQIVYCVKFITEVSLRDKCYVDLPSVNTFESPSATIALNNM